MQGAGAPPWRVLPQRRRAATSVASGGYSIQAIQCLWEAEHAWWEAKEADAAGDDAAVARAPGLFEEYQLAQVLSSTLMEYHLHGPSSRGGDGDGGPSSPAATVMATPAPVRTNRTARFKYELVSYLSMN